ncbi:MAG: Na+/H+ antiporter subunit E [Longimicrobiales bacterium]
MLRAIGLGAILYAFWLALSGHYTPLLLTLGVASCALVVYLALRMRIVDEEGAPFHLVGRVLLYLVWLGKEIVVANFHVAGIILKPGLPISPVMVTFRASQQTDLGRVLYANSITLTPGTITTRVRGHDLDIHSLTWVDVDAGEEDEMDRRVTWVEQGT